MSDNNEIIIFMNLQKARSHTEESSLEKQLNRMFFLAAEEKLLPKIVYDYSIQNKDNRLSQLYRMSVKNIYTKQTQLPLQYNPEEARTHREKFREKVLKLVQNELPIDYLRSGEVDGKRVMMYKGHPLQKVHYPEKQQFQIFKGFDQTKFKKGANIIFDDKLEYNHKNLISRAKSVPKKRESKICVTEPSSGQKYSPGISTQITTTPIREQSNIQPFSLPKLIARSKIERSRISSPPLLSVRAKKPTKINQCNQRSLIIKKMRQIGGYSAQTPSEKILITKESIIRFFKEFYPRPHRIIDFLEFTDVTNLQNYSKIPQRLKLMPNEHIYFMAFMLYDSNNDGYICDNDLFRVSELLPKCPLLSGDYNLMKNQGLKVEYTQQLPYKELYKLPQITEGTYFNWLKKKNSEEKTEKEMDKIQKEVKGYFGYLNRKKIMINYDGFKKLMKGQKPFLWYDLLWRISGITFADIKYEK